MIGIDQMAVIYKRNTQNLKILTPSGYETFEGIAYMGEKPIYRIELENDYWIECTDDHKLYINENTCVEAKTLTTDNFLFTVDGLFRIKACNPTGRIEPVYDIIGVSGGNKFYGNDILISNCRFIAYDETLINSLYLASMNEGIDPLYKIGETRFYEPLTDNKIYVVALDPSLGTGGDNAAIQVMSLPDLKQVGEWQHNMTPIKGQVTVMRNICDHIQLKAPNSEIYWSVENNTIGEAALVMISEMGEENIAGVFLSEPKKQLSTAKKHRKGFTTTHITKLSACAKLKQWVETEKLTINSKNLIRELKTFVASGTSYKAKSGENDDLVMSLILAIRMIQVVSKYDESTFDEVKESFDDDEYDMPMPIGFL